MVESRKVSTEEARSHFENMNPPIPYIETSAKTGENVKELFECAVRMWRDYDKKGKKDKCIIS